ncbi:unnamed protein product, partial [Didymodactylos carnosus]
SEIDDRYYNCLYKKLSEPEWKSSKMLSLFLNLLYKSLMKDTMEMRIKSFLKRLLQICLFNDVPFICGILLLISEVLKKHQLGYQLLNYTQRPNFSASTKLAADDDEDEHFQDVTEEEQSENHIVPISTEEQPTSSWLHKNLQPTKSSTSNRSFSMDSTYDLYKRNPLYSGSEYCCMHELIMLSKHCHPTVALFTQKLLQAKPIEYDGNPLIDFTSMRFLDRFIYKNPKKQLNKHEKLGHKLKGKIYLPKGVKSLAVDSDEYAKLQTTNVPVDEQFLHTFMKMRHENSKGSENKKDEDEDDNRSVESVSDTEFDNYLDQFMEQVDPDDIDEENDIASNLQNVSRKHLDSDEMTYGEDDQSDVDSGEEDERRPSKKHQFNLNDGEDNDEENGGLEEQETFGDKRGNNIGENFKVNNDKELKQVKWELDRERKFRDRDRKYESHLKKTGQVKRKLTRRQKRKNLHNENVKRLNQKQKKKKKLRNT